MSEPIQSQQGYVEANAEIGRAKKWDERTLEEQVALLRTELRNLRRENASQARFIADMAAHQHGPDGHLLVPYGLHVLSSGQGYGYDPLD